MGERPTPDAPRQGKRCPPRAPSCRPHSASSQQARARAVGLVTVFNACIPRTHSQWVVIPGRTLQRTGRWGVGERQTPDAPHPGKKPPPPGALVPPPQRAKPARKSARCVVGDGCPRPHPPHPQPVGSVPRPHARKDEWSGVGERPTPDAPHPGKRRPPWAPSCRPHSAQSQLARARAVGLVTGAHAHTPLQPQPVGSGPRPHARNDEWSGLGERPTPDALHPGKRRPPRAPSCLPHSAQSQLARARAVGLVTGPHARTHPRGARIPKPGRGKRDRPPPPEQDKRSTGPRQDTRRGTDRAERPYQRPAPGPREVRTPHQPGEGGRARTPQEHERTHTQRTRGENEKGDPKRACGTHRPHGMAYQRARMRDTRTGRPATHSAGNAGKGETGKTQHPALAPTPPNRPRAPRTHDQGTAPAKAVVAHCATHQPHAPAPRLGSLGASPRGSHWRQASSTGPAAPAPRATTH